MPGEKSYKLGNDILDIPESEVSAFLKDNPNATEIISYTLGKDTLDIPVGEVDEFLKETPGAQPLKKKEPLVSQLPSPLVSSNGASGSAGTPSGSSGTINYMTGQNNPVVNQPLNIPQQNPQDLLRSAGTAQEVIPVDQNNYSPEVQKTGYGDPMGEKEQALMRGMLRLGGSLMKAPGFVYDIASSVTNNVINRPFGLPDAPTASEIGASIPEELNVIKDVDQTINDLQKNQNQKYDQGISDYFSKGEYGKGFDLLSNAILESAPTTIALMMGNASGLSTAGSIGAGGLVFGAEKMSQLEKENPDMSQEQKLMVASANGLLEGAFEQFGLTKIGGLTKDVLLKEGADAARKVAEEGFKSAYRKTLSRYLGTSAEEALSEAATQFSQNAIDKYSGVNPDLDLKSGVVDAAIIGLGAGGSMSAPTTLMQVVKTKGAIKQAEKLEEQRKSLEEDIQSPDVTPEAKSAISEKLKDINQEEAALAKEETDKFNELTPDGKVQVNELLDKSKKLADAAIDGSISESTREIFKKEIDIIDKEIDQVYEENKNKPITSDVKVEDTDIQDEIDYINELKNSGIPLTEEETARLTELSPVTETPDSEMGVAQGEVKSEPVELSAETEAIPSVSVTEPEVEIKESVTKKSPPSKELVDEEEEIDPGKKDDDSVVKKMNTDIEAMKQMKTEDLAEKKFIGMIERAWKAKEEGKITRPTYTEFRNKAKDILAGKVGAKDNVESTEAKLKVTSALNKVKEKLLGQDYKKITLSSIIPITPKNISDLIDLANTISHRAIDAGFTVSESYNKALGVIKKHPTYKKLVASKEIDEKDFEKTFKESSSVKNKKQEPEKKGSDTEKDPDENQDPDIFGETRKKKTSARIRSSEKYSDIAKEINTDEDFYKSINAKKAIEYIDKELDSFEDNSLLEKLGEEIISGKNPFHIKIQNLAAAKLADRLRSIAQKEGNEMQKSAINKLAARILVAKNKNTNIAATQTAMEAEVAKLMPISEEGLKDFAAASFSDIQDTYHTEVQKKDIPLAVSEISEILQTEEGQKLIKEAAKVEVDKIASELKGKEWVAKTTEIRDSLKIDLTDC